MNIKTSKINNLTSFVNEILMRSKCDKRICHYKNIPIIIGLHRGLQAYKNIMESDTIIIPNIQINSANKFNITFNMSEIVDPVKFVFCMRNRTFLKKISVVKTTNNIIVKV